MRVGSCRCAEMRERLSWTFNTLLNREDYEWDGWLVMTRGDFMRTCGDSHGPSTHLLNREDYERDGWLVRGHVETRGDSCNLVETMRTCGDP